MTCIVAGGKSKIIPLDIIEAFRQRHVRVGHRVFLYEYKRGRQSIECETCLHNVGRLSMREKNGRQHHPPIMEITL